MSTARAWVCRALGVLALCFGVARSLLAFELPAHAEPGDLIFREGTEAVSAFVMSVDRGTYSHVGMLVGQRGQWLVLHATPSEVAGRADGVVLDSLAFFLDPRRAKRHAVYHVRAEAGQREKAVVQARKALGQPFRVADPAGTYCTLLVWRAWREAGVDFNVAFSALSLPLISGSYLLPSTLQASPQLQWLGPARANTAR